MDNKTQTSLLGQSVGEKKEDTSLGSLTLTPTVLTPGSSGGAEELSQKNIDSSTLASRTLERNESFQPQVGVVQSNSSVNGMNLSSQKKPESGKGIASSVVDATKQAADSNQEEYQTYARTKAREGLQDLAFTSVLGSYAQAYQDSNAHFATALEYSKNKGALYQLEQRGNSLVDTLNSLDNSYLKSHPYDIDGLNRQSGHIYTETMHNHDGSLHLTFDMGQASETEGGGYFSIPVVNLDSRVAEQKDAQTGMDIVTAIGSYHDDRARQEQAIEILQDNREVGATNLKAWDDLVSGNFGALDSKYKFTERYNTFLQSNQSQGTAQAWSQGSKKPIQTLRGTQEEVEALRNAVDRNGNSIFTKEELSELEECVEACGYNQAQIDPMMLGAMDMSKRRHAMNSLEEYQAAGVGAVTNAARVMKTSKAIGGELSGFLKEHKANTMESKTNKLLDKVSRKDSISTNQYEKAKKELDALKKQYKVGTDSELVQKIKSTQKNAKQQRDRKRAIRRATRGSDRTQARIALTRLRNEERMLKHGPLSESQTAHYTAKLDNLERKLNRQLKREKAVRSVMPGFVSKIANSRVVSAISGIQQGIQAALRKATGFLLKTVLPVAAAGVGVLIVCAIVVIIISAFCMMFMEDNGNVDEAGKEASDLQIVNEQLNDYESDQLADATRQVKEVVETTYTPYPIAAGYNSPTYIGQIRVRSGKVWYDGKWRTILGYYSKYDKASKSYIECTESEAKARKTYYVRIEDARRDDIYIKRASSNIASGTNWYPEVEPDYEVIDEYGKPANICNCLQLISMYRYYYYYDEGNEETENENFWINEFKEHMEDAWDNTHLITTKGFFDKEHTKTWDDTLKKGLKYKDVMLEGALPSGGSAIGTERADTSGYVYHTEADIANGLCENCGYFQYISGYDFWGNPIYTVTRHCWGHLKAKVKVQVDTDIKTLAKGQKLPVDGGYVVMNEDKIADTVDWIGCYDDMYEQGYEMYTEFEVYFGPSRYRLSSIQIEQILDKITAKYGELSKLQTAAITTALEGCGKFQYSMDYHWNCTEGVKGGATDCSGYVSWVHNNCGKYNNRNQIYTTTAWSLAKGHTTSFSLSTLKPGSVLILGTPGAASQSEGNTNHAMIWLGYLDGKPWVVECTGKPISASICRINNRVGNYKTAIPIGSSDEW